MRYRLTQSARRDIGSILRQSEERHGREARIRYAALLVAAMRRVALEPAGLATADRRAIRAGVRSYHIRHSRLESTEAVVGDPVHAVFYRALRPGMIEILRVLHERMEPGRHLGAEDG